MSTTYNNPISSLSYTNRDFSSIFPELLELAKTLTSRWDPSVSNESDPGVILLKLNAVIADKLNYNLDKNVLECFPLSVTQSTNARQLYKQLGYSMGYYKSGMTTVAMTWSDTATVSDGNYYATIPAFTMVTDVDNTIVYTLLGPTQLDSSIVVSSQRLTLDGTALYWNAIQGLPVKYSVNNSEIITADMLDSHNRLYFDVTDVAENGIFITHTNNANDYSLWRKTDNLLSINNGYSDDSDSTAYYYSFGITNSSDACYIEFPEDAVDIFKSGIEITYIRTAALDGDIPYNYLCKFESDLTPADTNYKDLGTLSRDNVKLLNTSASTGSSDIETIDEAYKNYRRTIGTYNTLITLRDYLNACITAEYASNGVVCSRNNDIQSTYKIMSLAELAHTSLLKTDTEEFTVTEDRALNAYNLKFYLTNYADTTIDTEENYNKTYNLLTSSAISDVEAYLEDLKSVEHEIAPIISPYTNIADEVFRANICLFKAVYPITTRITSTYSLATAEKTTVIENIKSALFKNFSAKDVVMGASPDASDISKVISDADSRIYSVYVDDIVPEIYAVYWNGEVFREINLTKPVITNTQYATMHSVDSSVSASDYNLKYLVECSTDRLDPIPKDDFNTAIANTVGWGRYKFLYRGLVDSTQQWVISKYTGGTASFYAQSQAVVNDISQYFTINQTSLKKYDEIIIEINPIDLIKKEILCKSILAGVTPYFIKDTEFFYDVNQLCITQSAYKKPTSTAKNTVAVVDYMNSIKASAKIPITNSSINRLADNENLQFFAPNLLDITTYNDYVKFEARIYSPSASITRIPANSAYALRDTDYIVFYWKDSTADTVYKYHIYGPGTIISPTFDIDLPVGASSISSVFTDLISELASSGSSELASSTLALTSAQSKIVSEITDSTSYLSGTSSVTIKKLNTVQINSTAKVYWILNATTDTNEYVLFNEDETSYTLNSGEYFIYANTALSELQFLGAGTKIVRDGDTSRWAVTAIDSTAVTSQGTAALTDSWFVFPNSSIELTLVEQQFVSLGSGIWVQSTKYKYSDAAGSDYPAISDTMQDLPADEIIKYANTSSTPTDDDWTTLPKMLLTDDFTWAVRSALTISVGPDVPQILSENHIISYTQLGHDEIKTISGVAASDESYPIAFMTSQNIISTGEAGFIPVYDIDSAGDKVYPSVYVYTEVQNSDIIRYSASGGATVYLLLSNMDPVSHEITVEFEFRHPSPNSDNGGTIISLYNPYKDVASLKVDEKISGTWRPVTRINSDITEFASPNMYLLAPKGTTSGTTTTISLRITFKCLTMTKTRTLTLLQAFRYDPNTALEYDYDTLQELLGINYDPDNEFDYTYAISDEVLIDNPLDSDSFLEASHIYNKNTICQIKTTDMTFNIYGGK